MKRLFVLFAAAAGLQVAGATDSVVLAPTPFEMPARIGPLRSDGQPHRFDRPELGVAYSYVGPAMKLDVYVYDAGLRDIPDGATSAVLCREFEGAKEGLLRFPDYGDIRVEVEQLALLDSPGTDLLAREAQLEFSYRDRNNISYLWLTAGAQQFVKMRFTAAAELREEMVEARRAILDALGAAMKPHMPPVTAATQATGPPAAEKGHTAHIDISLSPRDMQASMVYLMGLAAANEDAEPPACPGPWTPTYEAEVAGFASIVAVSRESKTGSKFEKKLREVEQAGFLREFVWLARHQDSWGAETPAGLDLEGFRLWAGKHLKRLTIPSLGTIEFARARQLPLETPAAGL